MPARVRNMLKNPRDHAACQYKDRGDDRRRFQQHEAYGSRRRCLARQNRYQQDHDHDGQILEDQDGEGELAVWSVGLILLRKQSQHDGC